MDSKSDKHLREAVKQVFKHHEALNPTEAAGPVDNSFKVRRGIGAGHQTFDDEEAQDDYNAATWTMKRQLDVLFALFIVGLIACVSFHFATMMTKATGVSASSIPGQVNPTTVVSAVNDPVITEMMAPRTIVGNYAETTHLVARGLAANATSSDDASCTVTPGSTFPTPSAVSITETVDGATASLSITETVDGATTTLSVSETVDGTTAGGTPSVTPMTAGTTAINASCGTPQTVTIYVTTEVSFDAATATVSPSPLASDVAISANDGPPPSSTTRTLHTTPFRSSSPVPTTSTSTSTSTSISYRSTVVVSTAVTLTVDSTVYVTVGPSSSANNNTTTTTTSTINGTSSVVVAVGTGTGGMAVGTVGWGIGTGVSVGTGTIRPSASGAGSSNSSLTYTVPAVTTTQPYTAVGGAASNGEGGFYCVVMAVAVTCGIALLG